MHNSKFSSFLIVATVLFSSAINASAQTIVNTGDDLPAIVAAASDGDEIQIHSSATFLGTLSWSAKSLTIIAAPGFTPTIKGSPGLGAISLPSSTALTRATLISLALERGADTIDPYTGELVIPYGITISGGPPTPQFVELTLKACSVTGEVDLSGTGEYRFTGAFVSTDFQNTLSLRGTGNCTLAATFDDCTFADELKLTGTGNLVQSVDLNNCKIAGYFLHGTTGSAQTTLNIRRTRLESTLHLSANSSSTLIAAIESSLITNNGVSTYGISAGGNIAATFTNVTVTGFPTGIFALSGVQWHNMLLANNTADLAFVPSTDIFNSLIEDGTYDGINGNFAGTALMSPSGNLLACSSGIDAGDNSAPNLGPTDLYGAPRIQDNDGNGIATVNVGATEASGTLVGTATVANGTGINPLDYTSTSLPTVGSAFTSSIVTPPGTALTIVAFDAPAAAPFPLPGFVGEIQVAVTPTMLLDFANGAHSQTIPTDCALIGVAISAQGFRAMTSGPTLIVHCLNSLDLVIGG